MIATGTMSAQQAAVTPAETKDANLRAYVELLRADVRAQKVAFITEMMEFTDAEDKAFWPIYREYDVELSTINDERVDRDRRVRAQLRKGERRPRRQARHQSARARGRGARRSRKSTYTRLKSALSPKTAARFLQVENQLLMIIDLQIAASLPIVK